MASFIVENATAREGKEPGTAEIVSSIGGKRELILIMPRSDLFQLLGSLHRIMFDVPRPGAAPVAQQFDAAQAYDKGRRRLPASLIIASLGIERRRR